MRPEDFGFEASNKLTCEAVASVQLLPDGIVEYRYQLRNSTASVQPAVSWDIEVDTGISTEGMDAPPRWAVGGCCKVDDVRRNATGIRAAGWVIDADDSLIQPGEQLGDFSFTTRSLPDVRRFFVEGFTENDMPEGEFPEEELESGELGELLDFFNNSSSGNTVGPEPIPEVLDLGALIDRLISLKQESVSLGWLRGDEFIKKLGHRLDQAKEALAEGKDFKARKRLEQFIKTLEERRKEQEKRQREASEKGRQKREERPEEDKRFINDNAFFLLKVNAEFIVARLPEKPQDRDGEPDADDEGPEP